LGISLGVDKTAILWYVSSMQASVRLKDITLVVVVIASMAVAILFPGFGSRFRALPFYCLMINFFLSYLAIDLVAVWRALRDNGVHLLVLTTTKLVILPPALYFVFKLVAPDYALSALLLSGVSAGVVAPMISNMVLGNSALVLVVVIITSALAPFTLPALIKMVLAKEVSISFLPMLRMLATVIFFPIVFVEIIRRLSPRLVASVSRVQFPISLLLFALINLGVFYQYAPFFRKEPSVILMATAVGFILAAVYCIVGIGLFRGGSIENQLAGAVVFGNLNNVLVIVFSSRFFGPVEPLVAAMYMIPFFALVIPLRYYRVSKQGLLGSDHRLA
jgi:bile acid:Na+ symporter, BASS family